MRTVPRKVSATWPAPWLDDDCFGATYSTVQHCQWQAVPGQKLYQLVTCCQQEGLDGSFLPMNGGVQRGADCGSFCCFVTLAGCADIPCKLYAGVTAVWRALRQLFSAKLWSVTLVLLFMWVSTQCCCEHLQPGTPLCLCNSLLRTLGMVQPHCIALQYRVLLSTWQAVCLRCVCACCQYACCHCSCFRWLQPLFTMGW